MNGSSRLTETQRLERYQSLRRATERHEPPVITEAELRGIFGDDSEEFLDTMRHSNVQMQIEVGADRSVRVWKAWTGYARAIVLGQSSPAITADDTADDIAGREPLVLSEYSLQVVSPGWVPIEAMRWLGFGPRTHPASPCQVPLTALLRRLTDPLTPPPCDDREVSRIWSQPMQMCVVTAEPARECVRLLDTGRTGVWGLHATSAKEVAALTPLTPRGVWRLLLTLGGSEQS